LIFNAGSLRLHLLIFLSLAVVTGNAQIDIRRYTTATDTFYWKRYIHVPEPPRVNLNRLKSGNPAKKIEYFLSRMGSTLSQYTSDSINVAAVKDLKKCLYPLEINGDQLPDMICSGHAGEPDIVRIWINRRDSFELVFEDYQYISKFTREGNKLVEMQVADAGGDNRYLYFTRDYKIHFENGEPVFVKGRQTVTYQYTEEPVKYYPQPVPFISKADTMMLRASAAKLNEPFNPHLGTFGNIVARYRTKTRGTALAYKSYGKGNDWFFVEVSPSSIPSASILYETEKLPTFIRGWVSGQAIQLIP